MAGKAKRARMPDSAKPSLLAWVLVLGGMAITTLLAFWRQPYELVGHVVRGCDERFTQLRSLGDSQIAHTLVFFVFVFAWAAHVLEAIYAWRLASRIDPERVVHWTVQTFLLGIFSLRFLLAMRDKGRRDALLAAPSKD